MNIKLVLRLAAWLALAAAAPAVAGAPAPAEAQLTRRPGVVIPLVDHHKHLISREAARGEYPSPVKEIALPGSAAEHLILALKRTGRATVVGETTAGMGHFGRVIELPAGFSAFIPIGRPSDPVTGIGWEGIGIKPHLEVPARKALETTLLRLGFASEQAQALGKKWTPSGDMERVIPLRATPL